MMHRSTAEYTLVVWHIESYAYKWTCRDDAPQFLEVLMQELVDLATSILDDLPVVTKCAVDYNETWAYPLSNNNFCYHQQNSSNNNHKDNNGASGISSGLQGELC